MLGDISSYRATEKSESKQSILSYPNIVALLNGIIPCSLEAIGYIEEKGEGVLTILFDDHNHWCLE